MREIVQTVFASDSLEFSIYGIYKTCMNASMITYIDCTCTQRQRLF